MPLLHLIDRPEDGPYGFEQRQRLGAFASAASHGAVLLLLVAAAQITRDAAVTTTKSTFDPQQIVWPPSFITGGGRLGGGDGATTPARRQKLRGEDQASIASTTRPTIDTTIEPPIEPLPITTRPMGDAISILAGPVTGEPASESLGPNRGRGGDDDGPGIGPGNGTGPGLGDGPRAGGPGVTTPVVIAQVKPQYTADAMRAKVQGTVWLECIVLTDGTVGEVRVIRSLDSRFGLDQEAIAAAKKWRFKPGLLDGKPVPVIVSIELSFTLR